MIGKYAGPPVVFFLAFERSRFADRLTSVSSTKLGNLGSSSSGLASANAAANGASGGSGEESLQWCHNGTHYLDGRGTIPPPGGAVVKQPWRTDGTNSQASVTASAVVYVLVVLLLYALALAVVLIKYVRRERYEARLYHLCDEFMRRDRFLRLSKRHSSIRSEPGRPEWGQQRPGRREGLTRRSLDSTRRRYTLHSETLREGAHVARVFLSLSHGK
ncbi:hypothetical protein MRX96_042448 [Rhipicephalus microplus]